jgi:hypothetical protein
MGFAASSQKNYALYPARFPGVRSGIKIASLLPFAVRQDGDMIILAKDMPRGFGQR